MRAAALFLFAFFLFPCVTRAETVFPPLTGRVVDGAHLLSAASRQSLENNLALAEKQSGHQFVVVTILGLEGITIEEYGVALGRRWGIGQKGANNGLLLIVAPKEHAVRIEVGYGLEGVMTDALSSRIIQQIILPSFREGNMEAGILAGSQAIISVLQGEPLAVNAKQGRGTHIPTGMYLFLAGYFLLFFWLKHISARQRRLFGAMVGASYLSSSSGGSYGGGSGGFSSGGGGFNGGGGSFGGGGSSGSW